MSILAKQLLTGTLFSCFLSVTAAQADVQLAVVHVFQDPLTDIISAFVNDNPQFQDITFDLTPGSAGGLYNDIYTALSDSAQSPYNIFFSVDAVYPNQLHTTFPSVAGTPFQYAQGSLILVSHSSINVTNGLPTNFGSTGVCNPSSGPYGDAGIDVLQNTYSIPPSDSRITQYNGIGLVKSAVKASTINTAFLAKTQVCNTATGQVDLSGQIGAGATGHEFTPGSGYAASILLHTGTVIARSSSSIHEDEAVAALASYLGGSAAQGIITSYCYSIPAAKVTAAQSYDSIKVATKSLIKKTKANIKIIPGH